MSRIRVLAARLRGLFGRARQERDLADEVQFHLDMQIEDNLRAGMDPAEARYAALRSFGGLDPMKDTYRDRRAFAVVETTIRDLRYAARTLRKSTGYTLTVAAVLTLAIGANTAMFSVLNTVLLQPLPFRAPQQLAALWVEHPAQDLHEGRSALWDVDQWRTQSRTFAGLATFDTIAMTLTAPDGVEPISGASVSANFFSLLGVRPVLGRTVSSDEAGRGQRLVLISHRFWQTRFGGARDALGATLTVDGAPCQIVGILPAGFQIARLDADVWTAHAARTPARGPETWFVVGRLQPDVPLAQAQAEMSTIARRLAAQMPAAERDRRVRLVPFDLYMVGPKPRLALWLLGGMVLCLFLIAAANVTSLSLARSVARTREMAVRAALGASRGRIVRQLLTEGVLLAAMSGLTGTLLAAACLRLVRTYGPGGLPRLDAIGIDPPAVGGALVLVLCAAGFVGFPPALAALRGGQRPSAGEAGRSVAGGRTTGRIRRVLVVADFALAIVLLAAAGLLIRSWWQVNRIDPGFRPERVLATVVSAPPGFRLPAQRTVLFDRMLTALQAVPGVESAGLIGDLFIANSREQFLTVDRAEGPVTEHLPFASDEVSPDVFRALGTPLLRGRFLSASDGPSSPLVALINESMARRSWPDGDPVGRRFQRGPQSPGAPWYTVVGVVADMRRQGLEQAPYPQVFVPAAQGGAPHNVDVFLRISGKDPMAVAGAVRAALHQVQEDAPVGGMAPLSQVFGLYLAQRRFQTALLAAFALVALLMAAVGLFGLVQYSVSSRTQEIGIRMAIGAGAATVFRMVLGEGLRLSATGVAAGLAGALWVGRLGARLLYGVAPADPWTLAAVSLLLIGVAAAACCLPARRAMRIEPVTALRQG